MEEKHVIIHGQELYHYGIMGQKWGTRRYQNFDGTLTEEGKARYYKAYDKFKKFALKNDRGFREQVKEKKAIDDEIDRKRQKKIDRAGNKAESHGDDAEEARQQAEEKFNKKLANSDLGDQKYKADSELIRRAEEKVRGFLGEDYNLVNSETSKKLGEEYVTMLLADAQNYKPLSAIFW